MCSRYAKNYLKIKNLLNNINSYRIINIYLDFDNLMCTLLHHKLNIHILYVKLCLHKLIFLNT